MLTSVDCYHTQKAPRLTAGSVFGAPPSPRPATELEPHWSRWSRWRRWSSRGRRWEWSQVWIARASLRRWATAWGKAWGNLGGLGGIFPSSTVLIAGNAPRDTGDRAATESEELSPRIFGMFRRPRPQAGDRRAGGRRLSNLSIRVMFLAFRCLRSPVDAWAVWAERGTTLGEWGACLAAQTSYGEKKGKKRRGPVFWGGGHCGSWGESKSM